MSLSENQRTQARLKLENQRLSADHENMLGLIDALKMPFWVRSAEGRLKWVNRAYAEADGQSPEFFAGKNHFALYPGAEAEAIFRRVVQTGAPSHSAHSSGPLG